MAYTSNKTLKTRIVNKNDIEENWLKAESFSPMEGEIVVYNPDATHSYARLKVGDGTTLVSNLPFVSDNIVSTNDNTKKLYLTGVEKADGTHYYNDSVYVENSIIYGLGWNDYAEYRQTKEEIKPGYVIVENGDDTLSLSTERLQPGANIVSDTFGFAIGKTEKCDTPIAISGRVLAYPYENRNDFKPGDAVCSGPNGTVSKMTREEIKEYPERIIGTVSAIPNYEIWENKNILINGRIWIKVK